ncbi:MAG: glycosyltransferase family 9 protein [Muribaculaceae bacterium]|nr:glycosyltransferase family 9 protein [Muribaculaceae bacterium]MDE6331929.1 glycosyltransferase family 9 protein [Muribaculaceae bacterium]
MQKNNDCSNTLGLINVLVARFSALGDVALAVPVLYSVARCYPDVRFIFVTRPSMVPIFVNKPDNLIVTGADVKNDYTGPTGILRLIKELRKEYSPDAFADLHDVLRTRVMEMYCRLNGIRVSRINKGRSGRKALTRSRNKVMLPLLSSRARYREVFYRLGLPVEDRFSGLYNGHGKAPATDYAVICPPRTAGERWIGIAPFAAHKGKIYPPSKMEQAVRAISENHKSIRIFLFGGGDGEATILNSWAERYPGVMSLAGKRFGFAAELALMNHLDVMLSMDSANMHLASIAGTRTITIWGATHPYCGFKGWRQSDADYIQLPMTCRPCSVFGNAPCMRGDYHCLEAIRPEIIVNAIDKVLAQ